MDIVRGDPEIIILVKTQGPTETTIRDYMRLYKYVQGSEIPSICCNKCPEKQINLNPHGTIPKIIGNL
jgi:hypothetical protein